MKKIQHSTRLFPALLCTLFFLPGSFASTLAPDQLPRDTIREVLLKKGTEVTLLTEELISSAAGSGTVVELSAYTEVKVGESVVISTGRYAEGEASARPAGVFGRPGRVSVRAITVQTTDGNRIPLDCIPAVGTGKDRKTLALVTSFILPVLGIVLTFSSKDNDKRPLGLAAGIGIGFLIKGKEAEIPAGTKIRAFVKRDVLIRV